MIELYNAFPDFMQIEIIHNTIISFSAIIGLWITRDMSKAIIGKNWAYGYAAFLLSFLYFI